MDNAPTDILAMKKVKLSNIKIVLLPPNTTSKTQPLDCRIIANLKAKYRKKHYFSVYTNQNKNWKPSIHDAILMMAISWNEISAETIINC